MTHHFRQFIKPRAEADRVGSRPFDRVEFGSRLQRRREELGWTRPQAADRFKSTVAFIVMLESGKAVPTIGEVVALAQCFATDCHWLLTGVESAAAPRTE